ncbi:MAG: hypothetical protein K6F73_01205 [Lachnospiraceae bacterium]|nr:hypothetical protein [Lachnospiraceae bacterium]
MGKPVKIRKKKSFMFTTRHYSFMSIMGILLGVFCVCVITTSVAFSYGKAGNIDRGFGGIGIFSMILNVIGCICGTISLGERDIYITPAIAAIVLNGVQILGWAAMIIISALA